MCLIKLNHLRKSIIKNNFETSHLFLLPMEDNISSVTVLLLSVKINKLFIISYFIVIIIIIFIMIFLNLIYIEINSMIIFEF